VPGRARKTLLLGCLLALCGGGAAYALVAEIGPVYVSATATMQPRELPKHGNAPISLSTVTRVGTRDGSTPPTLKTLVFMLDKNGTVDSKDWPVCQPAKLAGATPAQARKRCASALVGTGTGKALVTMPGKAPFVISSPLSFFNGPPTGGKPTLIAHAYEKVPTPQALVVPITIERVQGGRYGYRVQVEMPEVAGGYGAPILAEAKVSATRKRHGKKVGYINAHCVGGRLQVYGTVTFTNGDFFPTTLTSPCHFPR
jgi:hypothetical protein